MVPARPADPKPLLSLLRSLGAEGSGRAQVPGVHVRVSAMGISHLHLPPSCCSGVSLTPPSQGSMSTNTGQTPRPSVCQKLPILPLTSPFNAHRGAEPGAASLRRCVPPRRVASHSAQCRFHLQLHSMGWGRNPEHPLGLVGHPKPPRPLAGQPCRSRGHLNANGCESVNEMKGA